MIINSICIEDGLEKKEFVFTRGVNFIHSRKNSVGKTTLMRLLLYSLGFSIPGTKKMKFDRIQTSCSVGLDNGDMIELNRRSNDSVGVIRNGAVRTYVLPEEMFQVCSILFCSDNADICNNLLGVIYTDQEKGWTLLNRGVVIGKNTFNIESLIRGISNIDCRELIDLEGKLSRDISRLDNMISVFEFQQQIKADVQGLSSLSKYDEIESQKSKLLFLKENYTKQLKSIDRSLHDNKLAADFVEKMKILVELPNGEYVNVTKDNVCGLTEAIEFLVAKHKHLTQNINQVNRQLDKLYDSQKQDSEQMVFFEEESIFESFARSIVKVRIDEVAAKKKRDLLREQRSNVRNEIAYQTRSNSAVIFSMYNNMVRYMTELGIGNSDEIAAGYLFTSNLKELSGALLHKTVFAFKLSYILELEKKLNVKLPILLDSPRGKEVDEDNANIMMHILKRDFSGNQIIMASIYQYDFENPKIIEINNRLMEVVEDVSCHNISE